MLKNFRTENVVEQVMPTKEAPKEQPVKSGKHQENVASEKPREEDSSRKRKWFAVLTDQVKQD